MSAVFVCEIKCCKYLFLFGFQKTFMFFGFFCKKRLRLFGNNLRTPFTGGAEAHNGAADGATEDTLEGSEVKKMRQ
ncbi:MAG: hypothetical protein OIF54_05445 [Cohaesibacter sp.]|nr:hypothetical protein [Cohaesibacter sp.]